MNTLRDVPNRGDGGTTPSTGPTPDVLPKANLPIEEASSQTGVSTRNAPNATRPLDAEPHWYTIRCAYGKEKIAYEYFTDRGIKAFYPTIITRKHINGKKTLQTESRLPNIFFAYGTFDSLKEHVYDNVHNETKHVRFYYNHHHDGTKEPLIVPDRQMQSLMLICNSNADDTLFEPYTIEKFCKGQEVLVKEGMFAGVRGIVARFKGQQRVGITIKGLLTAVTAYVPSAFLERITPKDE